MPIIIWMVKKDVPVIVAIARQAILLNVIVFVLIGVGFVLLLTIILIPGCDSRLVRRLAVAAIALPIVGAIKANGGVFYQYPVVGSNP